MNTSSFPLQSILTRHPFGACIYRHGGVGDYRWRARMGADGRELLQGQADVSPRVPRMDLRRPLEGERQHAELHVADDPVGGPVVDRRPPPTGASPSDLSEPLRYIVCSEPVHSPNSGAASHATTRPYKAGTSPGHAKNDGSVVASFMRKRDAHGGGMSGEARGGERVRELGPVPYATKSEPSLCDTVAGNAPWRRSKDSSSSLRTLAFSLCSYLAAWECQSQRKCPSSRPPS